MRSRTRASSGVDESTDVLSKLPHFPGPLLSKRQGSSIKQCIPCAGGQSEHGSRYARPGALVEQKRKACVEDDACDGEGASPQATPFQSDRQLGRSGLYGNSECLEASTSSLAVASKASNICP